MSLLPSQKHQDKLSKMKATVKRAYDYFQVNYKSYNEFRKFVFDTSLSDADITLLTTLGRPQLEFNILEAYISRLLGEFSHQEPSIAVNADDPETADPTTIKCVEQHLRHVLNDSSNSHTKYEVYKDLLSGGFSVLKVHTEYSSPMSMKQDIKIDRVYDPTLCGFDNLARESHKGDGRFCFENFPMSKDEFKELYPDVRLDELSFVRGMEGFNWSYINDNSEMLIICDYYEKRKIEKRIVSLNNGKIMTMEEYKDLVKNWSDITLPPAIVGKPRKTILDKITRYRFIENIVIEVEHTDFTMLPLVFVDGNSILVKEPKNGNIRQITRPYVYHAKGAQRLKNFAGISLANAIENEVQHKFMVAKEALPKEEEYLNAYVDIQKTNVLVFNSVYEGNPDQPINNPINVVPKVAAPPEIMQAFQFSDQVIQAELGSFDSTMGKMNTNQTSSLAIVESASQSNSAAMPYIVGFMYGLQRAAQIYVDLLPKYYTTPRTLPMRNEKGEHFYIKINENENTFDYDENALNVTVKASASFQVQKSRTISMVKEMMGMSPLFAQFIAEKGLNFVLENMEGKGIEQLKQMVDQWLLELQQQKQQAMMQQQQEAQNAPAMMRNQIDMQKLQLEQQRMQMEHQIDILKLEAEHNKIDADLHMNAQKDKMDLKRAEIDQHDKMIKNHLAADDMHHKHAKESIELIHEIGKPQKEEKESE